MKKKALFFDYDGTLISDETHTIPKSARKVLNKLKDKGYLLLSLIHISVFELSNEKDSRTVTPSEVQM